MRQLTSNLWGEFQNTVDEKGRVTIPAGWRAQLAEPFFVCPGINGNCLFILPRWRWTEIQETLTQVKYNNEQGMALQRLFGSGSETKLDGQGRLLIPPKLRARAGITNEAVLSGAFERIEVWNPAEYQSYGDQKLNPEAVRESAASMQL